MDDSFFSRAATWSRTGGQRLTVHDSFSPKAPRVITMEPWHEVAFMAADGEHSVGDFIRHMGSQYDGGMPAGLSEQIRGIIRELVAEGVIRLHPEPKSLPPYFAEDHFAQPADVREAQMESDGLLPRSLPHA